MQLCAINVSSFITGTSLSCLFSKLSFLFPLLVHILIVCNPSGKKPCLVKEKRHEGPQWGIHLIGWETMFLARSIQHAVLSSYFVCHRTVQYRCNKCTSSWLLHCNHSRVTHEGCLSYFISIPTWLCKDWSD